MGDLVPDINKLQVKIFADGADLDDIRKLSQHPAIKGFTTNPTLMRKAEVQDYRAFAQRILEVVADRPVSFEVFSDELPRSGGTDLHPQPLTYICMGIGF